MFLDDEAPIAGGREIWGFPKKLANVSFKVETDTLVGTLDYGRIRIATGTMGYKYKALDTDAIAKAMVEAGFLLKIIPNVDCKPRILELVRYYLEDVTVKGAWTGPAQIELDPSRAGAADRSAGARGGVGGAFRRRPDARPWRSGPRLPQEIGRGLDRFTDSGREPRPFRPIRLMRLRF